MKEEVRKILGKVSNVGGTDAFVKMENLETYLGIKAQQICQLFPKSPDNPDGYEPKPYNVVTNSGKKLIGRVAREEGMEISIEPKPDRLLTDEEMYFIICGHVNGDLKSCCKGWCAKCSFRLPRLEKAIAELQVYFVKTASIKEAKISYWREKCWNDTMSAKKSGYDDAKAECQERVEKILDGIEIPYDPNMQSISGMELLKYYGWKEAIQTIKQALKEGVK